MTIFRILSGSRPLLASLVAVGLLIGAATAVTAAEPANLDDRPVIGIENKRPIKVVIQMTTAETKDGIGKGLIALKKLHEGYLQAGVAPSNLEIHAVIHGDGAVHLLADEAWNRIHEESDGNPSAELISELVKKGISVELCDSRRRQNGWEKSDVYKDVRLVEGAYQRIIDLQLQGYAYIRF